MLPVIVVQVVMTQVGTTLHSLLIYSLFLTLYTYVISFVDCRL